jgi:hypothetical protein
LAQLEGWSSLTHFIILPFFFVEHSNKFYTADSTRQTSLLPKKCQFMALGKEGGKNVHLNLSWPRISCSQICWYKYHSVHVWDKGCHLKSGKEEAGGVYHRNDNNLTRSGRQGQPKREQGDSMALNQTHLRQSQGFKVNAAPLQVHTLLSRVKWSSSKQDTNAEGWDWQT